MKDFTDILEEIVDSMDLTIKVDSVVGDKIFVCKTLHLRELRVIEDENGNEYEVLDVSNDEWIQVEAIDASPATYEGETVICSPVQFMFGTPRSMDGEYQMISVASGDKTPLVYLLEPYRELNPGDRSNIEREVTPKIFFLDETGDDEGWTNRDHHKMSVQPMLNLASLFMETVNKNRMFKRVEQSSSLPRVRFGKHIDQQGYEAEIITELLSGVERQPTLIKYKEKGCQNC